MKSLFTLFLIFHASLMAQSQEMPQLIKDINPDDSSHPEKFFQVGDIYYFVADDGTHGEELWKTDGTPNGTALVLDINPGEADADVNPMGEINGILYFMADDGATGRELWKTDGSTAGTQLVAEIKPGSNGGFDRNQDAIVFNDVLYFGADSPTGNSEFWRSDGTEAGTYFVKDICPFCGTANGTMGNLFIFQDMIYFTGQGDFWKSDGTEAGTELVYDKDDYPDLPAFIINPRAIGDKIYFGGDVDNNITQQDFYISDGTPEGTILVDLNPDGASKPRSFIEYKGMVYFIANFRLYRTDGTPDGTELFKDLILDNPANASDGFETFYIWNDRLYFSAQEGENFSLPHYGYSISDDPDDLVQLEKNTYNEIKYAGNDDFLFFIVETGFFATKIGYISTNSNFVTILDFNPPAMNGYSPDFLNILGDKLIYSGNGVGGRELYAIELSELSNLAAAPLELNNFSAFPNPTDANLKISFDQQENLGLLQIMDMTGRVVEKVYLNQSARGQQTLELDLSKLNAGNYHIVITSENGVFTEQITVK